jgi:hypothetical protein
MAAGDGWAFPFIQFGLIRKPLLFVRHTHKSDVSSWPFATFRCLVAVGGIADIGTRWRPEGSVACDPERTPGVALASLFVLAEIDRTLAFGTRADRVSL